MTNKEIVREVIRLYHEFLREHNVTPKTVYANILWLWPDYLRNHKTW